MNKLVAVGLAVGLVLGAGKVASCAVACAPQDPTGKRFVQLAERVVVPTGTRRRPPDGKNFWGR